MSRPKMPRIVYTLPPSALRIHIIFIKKPMCRMTVNRLDVEAELAARATEALALQASERRRMDEQESQFQALHDEQRRLLG